MLTKNKKCDYNKKEVIKETDSMNNLINVKLNNWWKVWANENYPYSFVML